MLIKCDRVNFVGLNTFLTVIFCSLKLAKQIKFQFYFGRILHFKPFRLSEVGIFFV